MRRVPRLQVAVVTAVVIAAGAATAGQTLYAGDNYTNGVISGVVQLDGGTLTESSAFITAGTVAGLATDGANIFASLPDGISRYDTSGGLLGSYANIGIDSFGDLAVSAGTLYAADNYTNGVVSGVVELDAASLIETGAFVTDGHIAGLATNGTDIFASLPGGISEYDLAGNLLGSYDNIGIDSFGALSYAGGVLYAADNYTNGLSSGVLFLDASLCAVGSFITPGHVAGLASDGVDVFVSLPDGISEFTTSGDFVRSYANVGIDSFGALALAPSGVPEPVSWALMMMGFGMAGARFRAMKFVPTDRLPA